MLESAYVLKDEIAKIEAFLKEHGYRNGQMNKLFDAAAAAKANFPTLADAYLDILNKEKAKIAKPNQDVDVDQDMYASGPEELISKDELDRLAGNGEKQLTNRDEGMIKVLQLLGQQLRPQGKDKARVIAARMKVDPDIFQTAGLGALPEHYTDEDVWKTLDLAKGKPFYDHVWQTFYTAALEQMQSLPVETRDYIEELLSDKREVPYPSKPYDNNAYRVQDDRMAYECKTISDLVVESNGHMDIIQAGTKIIVS